MYAYMNIWMYLFVHVHVYVFVHTCTCMCVSTHFTNTYHLPANCQVF